MSELEQQEQAKETGIETQTPGQLLRQARIQSQLSEQDVADSLNLKLIVVQTIEQDHFDQMPAATFTKGYLRSYAKLLGVDDQQVISLYEKQGVKPADPKLDMKSFSKRPKLDNGDHKFSFAPFLLLLIILAAAGFFWLKGDSLLSVEQNAEAQSRLSPVTNGLPNNALQAGNNIQTNKSVVTPAESASTKESNLVRVENSNQIEDMSVAKPEATNPTTEAVSSIDAQNANSGQSNEQTTARTASQSLDIKSAETAISKADVNQSNSNNIQTNDVAQGETLDSALANQISMEFTEDCWINVVDSTGERIAYGVKKAGRNMQVTGVAPFKVTLGAPENVAVRFESQNVDMSQFKKGMVARFSLPLENG